MKHTAFHLPVTCYMVVLFCMSHFLRYAPKFLPSGQSMVFSRAPGQLGFPIQACCVINATYLLHVTSIA